MRPILERFCACKLQDAALVHGLRAYHDGATLIPHLDWADRWVVSATISVCHRRGNASTERGWPFVVQASSLLPGGARASELAIREGEALLYEGSRLYHGRPTPLGSGEEYVGVFAGFVPEAYPRDAGPTTRLVVGTVKVGRALGLWMLSGRGTGSKALASWQTAAVAAGVVGAAVSVCCGCRRWWAPCAAHVKRPRVLLSDEKTA
eukprot:4871064-Prymnesium_polylepis.2